MRGTYSSKSKTIFLLLAAAGGMIYLLGFIMAFIFLKGSASAPERILTLSYVIGFPVIYFTGLSIFVIKYYNPANRDNSSVRSEDSMASDKFQQYTQPEIVIQPVVPSVLNTTPNTNEAAKNAFATSSVFETPHHFEPDQKEINFDFSELQTDAPVHEQKEPTFVQNKVSQAPKVKPVEAAKEKVIEQIQPKVQQPRENVTAKIPEVKIASIEEPVSIPETKLEENKVEEIVPPIVKDQSSELTAETVIEEAPAAQTIEFFPEEACIEPQIIAHEIPAEENLETEAISTEAEIEQTRVEETPTADVQIEEMEPELTIPEAVEEEVSIVCPEVEEILDVEDEVAAPYNSSTSEDYEIQSAPVFDVNRFIEIYSQVEKWAAAEVAMMINVSLKLNYTLATRFEKFELDAYGQKNGVTYVLEVKYWPHSISNDKIKVSIADDIAVFNKLKAAYNQIDSLAFILALVVDNLDAIDKEDIQEFALKLKPDIRLEFFEFETLKSKYHIPKDIVMS